MTVEDRKSWATKDEAVVHELLGMLQITPEECALLASLQDEARANVRAMVDEFYQRLLAHEFTREFITDPDALRVTLTKWFMELFSGKYDDAYAASRLAIGLKHVLIGLPVRYPLMMLDVISRHGEKIAAARGPAAVDAFRKVLALDTATFNQAYENCQLLHLSELTGSERLARRLLTGEV